MRTTDDLEIIRAIPATLAEWNPTMIQLQPKAALAAAAGKRITVVAAIAVAFENLAPGPNRDISGSLSRLELRRRSRCRCRSDRGI
jgi:hypothetical protein